MSAVVTDQLLDTNKVELPRSWRMATIGELLKVRNGFAFKSADYQDDGVLLIRQSNLDGARVTLNKSRFVPSSYLAAHKEFLVKKGDILIGMSGSIGKLCTYDRDEPALQNQRTGLLVFKDPEQKRWVWHYLPLLEKELLKVGKGVAVQNISASQIESFPIPVAPLDQQKRIVAEIEKQFSRLDEAVANLKRVKANLKSYKAAVLKAAVEGRLVETEAELARKKTPSPLAGQAVTRGGFMPLSQCLEGSSEGRGEGVSYETGEQLLQRILETRRSQWKGKGKYKEPTVPDTTKLPELPEGWVLASVEQMADVGTGATPLRSKREYYDDGKIPWVTSGALNEEFVSAADEYITDLAVQATNAKVFPEHTLLVAMYGEGKTRGKVSELLIEAATNQACAAIIMEGLSAKIRDYVKFFFLKNYEDIRRLSSGGVQPNLNLSHIKATVIPLPPLAEQCRIVAEVDRLLSIAREAEAEVDANLKRAQVLRQAILSKMFGSQP